MVGKEAVHSGRAVQNKTNQLLRALAGEKADLFLKSRLSLTKLNVKIRLFDGYDWPDKCSASQKRAVKRSGKTFVIEPLPGVEERKVDDLPEEKSTAHGELEDSATTTTNISNECSIQPPRVS